VTEETVKKYIENQKDEPSNFQIWDEKLESDCASREDWNVQQEDKPAREIVETL